MASRGPAPKPKNNPLRKWLVGVIADALAADRNARPTSVNITVNNPVKESSSEAIRRAGRIIGDSIT